MPPNGSKIRRGEAPASRSGLRESFARPETAHFFSESTSISHILLYTDGVTEPENAHGDSFGDIKLEQVVREGQRSSPSELSDQLLSELGHWRPASITQQDDITLIVIDAV